MTPDEKKLWRKILKGLREEMKAEAALSAAAQNAVDKRLAELLRKAYKAGKCAKARDEVIAAANEYSQVSLERQIAYHKRIAAVAKSGTVGVGVVEVAAAGIKRHGSAGGVATEAMKETLEEVEVANELKATELEVKLADKKRWAAYKKLEKAWKELQKCKGGYRFEGLKIVATFPDVTVTQEFSGSVCGDPYEKEWEVTQVVTPSPPGDTRTFKVRFHRHPAPTGPGANFFFLEGDPPQVEVVGNYTDNGVPPSPRTAKVAATEDPECEEQ